MPLAWFGCELPQLRRHTSPARPHLVGRRRWGEKPAWAAGDAPPAVIASAVELMSKRLLADVAAQVNMPNQLGGKVPPNETNDLAP